MIQDTGHVLPDKLYFRIGEVSDIVGVKPYVLRYWETEFSDIKPTKSKSGQRLYRKRDVELLLKIKELLYAKRFTINGAKQRLKEVDKPDVSIVHETPVQQELMQESETLQVSEDASHQSAEAKVSSVDKKFLEKMKNDLEWCLTEIRLG